MNLSDLSGSLIIGAFLTLALDILTATGIFPVFLFNVTQCGNRTFPCITLVFDITIQAWGDAI
ncbi:uncharacterized protein METZ01_LOCUS123763 [marine metagenome]|uniref:Uncharacterized protein n=1 Tax=marine metagenome TaxID=408172 RepID=A0A381Y1I2_9ZZZZ